MRQQDAGDREDDEQYGPDGVRRVPIEKGTAENKLVLFTYEGG
jgi:hypothetical protein